MTEVSEPVAAVITCRDDLVEILRARKAELGLSNSYVEHQLQMGDGNADKFIGPVPTKGNEPVGGFGHGRVAWRQARVRGVPRDGSQDAEAVGRP